MARYVARRDFAAWLDDDSGILAARIAFIARGPRMVFAWGTWRATLRAAQRPLLCSVAEAATRLKVSIPTIRRRIKAGELPTVRIGNSIRVDLTHIHGVDAAGIAKLAAAARRPTLTVVNDVATPSTPGKRGGST